MATGLDSLPDDILYVIVAHIGTAREVARISRTCRRLHQFMSDKGWRTFSLGRFPSLAPSMHDKLSWAQLAQSLTFQSRCWDRRSLSFTSILPLAGTSRPHGRRGSYGSRAAQSYHTVLDVHYDTGSGEELLAWGAGENLIARFRQQGPRGVATVEWRQLSGKDLHFKPGYDDISALRILEDPQGRGGTRGILAGRHNGQISLHSADQEGFGRLLSTFAPQDTPPETPGRDVVQQKVIHSLDVSRSRVIAAATQSHLLLYSLGDEAVEITHPHTALSLADQSQHTGKLGRTAARWMAESDLLAVALSVKDNPLHYVKLAPWGCSLTAAVKNTELNERFQISDGAICTNSIQPISNSSIPGGGGSLLLSAWTSGVCKLQDIRTPSPVDMVYSDNITVPTRAEALLPFGTERFVAAGPEGNCLKIFDFRWPRAYSYTSALPCSRRAPFPAPCQPFFPAPAEPTGGGGRRAVCCTREPCAWHRLSRDLYYRPNCSLYLHGFDPTRARPSSVWSLARASDASPTFYVGVTGGLLEANLCPSHTGDIDPNLGFRTLTMLVRHPADAAEFNRWPRELAKEVGYVTMPLDTSILETGDGMAHPDNEVPIRMPRIRNSLHAPRSGISPDARNRHRLDWMFHELDDFQ